MVKPQEPTISTPHCLTLLVVPQTSNVRSFSRSVWINVGAFPSQTGRLTSEGKVIPPEIPTITDVSSDFYELAPRDVWLTSHAVTFAGGSGGQDRGSSTHGRLRRRYETSRPGGIWDELRRPSRDSPVRPLFLRLPPDHADLGRRRSTVQGSTKNPRLTASAMVRRKRTPCRERPPTAEPKPD